MKTFGALCTLERHVLLIETAITTPNFLPGVKRF